MQLTKGNLIASDNCFVDKRTFLPNTEVLRRLLMLNDDEKEKLGSKNDSMFVPCAPTVLIWKCFAGWSL